MRHALKLTLLAAMILAGCEKPQGPQTTEPQPPGKAAAKPLPPLEPLGTETSMGADALMGPPRPMMVARPEPLLRPETTTPPAPADAGGAGYYTIKKGDTFIKLARELYGNESRFRDIQAANPGVDPGKLQVGQRIALPPK